MKKNAAADLKDLKNEKEKALDAAISQLEKELPLYGDLSRLEEQRRSASLAEERLHRQALEDQARLERDSAGVQALRQRLDELADADALELQARQELKKARETLALLDGDRGLRPECRAIRQAENRWEQDRRRLRVLEEQALAASREHQRLYERFIAGQAGLLAEDLRERLISEGQAPCPVCNSRLSREQLGQLARRQTETPDEAQVDRAKQTFDELEEQRRRLDLNLKTDQTALELRKRTAVEKAAAVRHYLRDKGVEAVDFDDAHAQYFDCMPGAKRETVCPALLAGGQVLRRGMATVPER